MDPNNIQEIVEFHDNNTLALVQPSQMETYKLKGQTTKIAHTTLDVRDVVCKGRFGLGALKAWGGCVKHVCVKEIKIEWSPHVELNHVAFMNVVIHNAFTTDSRNKKKDTFFEGMFPIHVHWAVAISSPRWIKVEKFLCESPWSYTITARNMPQDALERAGEMTLSYVIEKGHKNQESNWSAPIVIMDPVPFPYMVPYYKYRSPGGLYESNMSSIKGIIKSMKESLVRIGINKTITDEVIWAISNTINASMQQAMVHMSEKNKEDILGTMENMINLLVQDKSPGYPRLDQIMVMDRDTLGATFSKEISGIGDEMGSSIRYSNVNYINKRT